MASIFQLCLSIFLIFFKTLFWIAAKLRLAPALLYALLVGTVFLKWEQQNQQLALGILIVLVALAALSWIFDIVKFVRERFALG